MNQMAENKGTAEATDIVERMVDQVGDAIGGQGSLSVISGGSSDQRRSVISQVLQEAEGMGCQVSRCSGVRSGKGQEPLAGALSELTKGIAGDQKGGSLHELGSNAQEDRSYRSEMACLNMLRSLSLHNAVVLAVEDIESACLDTIMVLSFLARNIGGMNVLMIASHRSSEEDPLLVEKLDDVRHSALVHELHIHGTAGHEENGSPILHEAGVQGIDSGTEQLPHSSVQRITELIDLSRSALKSGNVHGALEQARSALEDSRSICHYGFMIDSFLALGIAQAQQGMEKESLDAFDHALELSITVGEFMPQYLAQVGRSELLLFSVGEPDTAFAEAANAAELWSQSPEDTRRIEPLALMAVIEAKNGRRDRAERTFCEATEMLGSQPADKMVLERMLLALAAALLLESRRDLQGMNKRYEEAAVLATGTDHSTYWTATISLQRGRSLLRLRRPREAREHMDNASRWFELLGNAIQSSRAKRAAEESEVGPVLE
jgi:tetratricopeptide (TPR) repeat protein